MTKSVSVVQLPGNCVSHQIFSNLLKVSSKIVLCWRLRVSDNNIQWENDGRVGRESEREVFTTKYDAKVNRTLKSNFLYVILLLIKVFPLKLETN